MYANKADVHMVQSTLASFVCIRCCVQPHMATRTNGCFIHHYTTGANYRKCHIVVRHDKTDKSNTGKLTKKDPGGCDHRGCVADHDILEAPLRYLHRLCHRFRTDHIAVAVVGCWSERWGFDPGRGGRVSIGRMHTTTQNVQHGLT